MKPFPAECFASRAEQAGTLAGNRGMGKGGKGERGVALAHSSSSVASKT